MERRGDEAEGACSATPDEISLVLFLGGKWAANHCRTLRGRKGRSHHRRTAWHRSRCVSSGSRYVRASQGSARRYRRDIVQLMKMRGRASTHDIKVRVVGRVVLVIVCAVFCVRHGQCSRGTRRRLWGGEQPIRRRVGSACNHRSRRGQGQSAIQATLQPRPTPLSRPRAADNRRLRVDFISLLPIPYGTSKTAQLSDIRCAPMLRVERPRPPASTLRENFASHSAACNLSSEPTRSSQPRQPARERELLLIPDMHATPSPI